MGPELPSQARDGCCPGMVSGSLRRAPPGCCASIPQLCPDSGADLCAGSPCSQRSCPAGQSHGNSCCPCPAPAPALQPGPVPPSGSPHPDTGPHWFSRQRGLSWKPDPTQATPPRFREPACTSLLPTARSTWDAGDHSQSPPKATWRGASSGTRAGSIPGGPRGAPRFTQAPSTQGSPSARRQIPLQLPCPRWCSIPHTLACTHSHARTCSVTNHTQ